MSVGNSASWGPRRAMMAAFVLLVAGVVYFAARELIDSLEVSVPRLALAAIALAIGTGCGFAVAGCRTRRQGVALALMALCGIAIATLLPPGRDDGQQIRLTATGEHSPKAGGSEVWVPDVVPGRVYFEGPGWERRDDRVSVSWQSQPNTATLRGPWREGDVLRLTTHPQSGVVELHVGNYRQRIDLYSPQQGAVAVTLPAPAATPARAVLHGALPVLLLLAMGGALLRLPRPWPLLLVAGTVLGTATLVHLHSRSFPGELELLAYGDGELTKLEADIGHGMFDIPIGSAVGGRAAGTSARNPDGAPLRLRAATGDLQPVRELSQPALQIVRSGPDGESVCAGGQRVQVFQWIGDRSGPLRLDGEGQHISLSNTPAIASARTPAYVVVVCDGASVQLFTTTAHIAISPWSQPWWQVRQVRARSSDGHSLPLLQLSGERPSGFVTLDAAGDGAYVPHRFVRPDTRAVVIEKVLAAALVALLPALLWLAATNLAVFRRHWVSGTRALALLCYALPPLWVAATLAVQWPGTVGWDAFSPYIQMHAGTVTLWYGIGYPLVIAALSLLMAPSVIALSQCVVMALVVQAVTVRTLDTPRSLRWVGLATCLLMPLTVVAFGATVHLRDAMNGTLMALFGVGWFYTMVDGDRWGRAQRGFALALLALLALGLVLLRVDDLAFLGLTLAAVPLFAPGARRRAAVFAVAVLALCLLINAAMERAVFGSREALIAEKNSYKQTAFVSPLVGYLVDPDSRLSPERKAALARDLAPLFDLPAAIREWQPDHVIWWHQSVTGRPPPSADQIAALQRHYVGTMLEDPLRFLRMRSAMFLSTLGHKWISVPPVQGERVAPVLLDRIRIPNDPESVATARLLGFDLSLRPWPALSERLHRFVNAVATTLPQLAICIVLLFCARWVPVAAVLSLALLARAAVFFFFAPADVFLYLFDMHVLGFLLPAMAVYEWGRRRTRAPSSKEWES